MACLVSSSLCHGHIVSLHATARHNTEIGIIQILTYTSCNILSSAVGLVGLNETD